MVFVRNSWMALMTYISLWRQSLLFARIFLLSSNCNAFLFLIYSFFSRPENAPMSNSGLLNEMHKRCRCCQTDTAVSHSPYVGVR